MYAIIQDGRQLQVEPGQELNIDYRDLSAGAEVTFDRVLAYRDDAGLRIGRPTLPAATVTAKVLTVAQGPKLVVQKFRRRKNAPPHRPSANLYPRGHRQDPGGLVGLAGGGKRAPQRRARTCPSNRICRP